MFKVVGDRGLFHVRIPNHLPRVLKRNVSVFPVFIVLPVLRCNGIGTKVLLTCFSGVHIVSTVAARVGLLQENFSGREDPWYLVYLRQTTQGVPNKRTVGRGSLVRCDVFGPV